MFQGQRGGGRGGGVGAGRGPPIKLMISNLDYGVSTDDIKVSEGKGTLHYDCMDL